MKVLITGANGFLGYYVAQLLLKKGFTVIATGKGECRLPFNDRNFIYVSMDFTDPFSVHEVFEKLKPEIIVHAGAMSKTDDCELHQSQAYVVNLKGTLNLLANAEEQKSFFIFISTDFVFDGKRGMYREDDETGPVNFYGKTKLEAEDAVREYNYDWAVARTILVYGKNHTGRDNILSVVKQKLTDQESYRVVDDQIRTPTYVEDLAKAIVLIIEKKAKGIYHISGKDVLTPYQIAVEAAKFLGYNDSLLIQRISSKGFFQPAVRPLKTGFIIEKAKRDLGFEPISFEEGLQKAFS
jgi:dTDP-4-dehydrorhamnose reductase